MYVLFGRAFDTLDPKKEDQEEGGGEDINNDHGALSERTRDERKCRQFFTKISLADHWRSPHHCRVPSVCAKDGDWSLRFSVLSKITGENYSIWLSSNDRILYYNFGKMVFSEIQYPLNGLKSDCNDFLRMCGCRKNFRWGSNGPKAPFPHI